MIKYSGGVAPFHCPIKVQVIIPPKVNRGAQTRRARDVTTAAAIATQTLHQIPRFPQNLSGTSEFYQSKDCLNYVCNFLYEFRQLLLRTCGVPFASIHFSGHPKLVGKFIRVIPPT